MSILSEAVGVVPALFSGSAWEMRDAFYTDGMWVFCFFLTLLAGILAHLFYKYLPFMDRHLERGIAVVTYLMIAAIICWGVIDRFIFQNQWSGSTTVPPFLFMIMAWFACSYNVRLRTHLNFSEFRTKMSRNGQIATLFLDTVLVDGIDDTMKWWFYITIPVAFMLMSGRVVGNWLEDWNNYRTGQPIIKQAVIGGDV